MQLFMKPFTDEKIKEAENGIETLMEMSIEEYIEQFKDKVSADMMKQWFLWFTQSTNSELQKKWRLYLKKKNDYLYTEKIKKKLDHLTTKSINQREDYELVRVRKYTYTEWEKEYEALIVGLEYYDMATKKTKYSDSIIVEDRYRKWIIKSTENKIPKLSQVYHNKL